MAWGHAHWLGCNRLWSHRRYGRLRRHLLWRKWLPARLNRLLRKALGSKRLL